LAWKLDFRLISGMAPIVHEVPSERSSSPARTLPEECLLLRIFIGEADEYKHRPLYKAIVLRARELHLAGATVLRGPMGFGQSHHLHNANILRLSFDLPMVVEIVDTNDRIDAFLPELQAMMRRGLITVERARIIRYQ
jgi:PII-like signaling protein